MATTTPDAVPLSIRELTADVGLVRRILRGRKWYGTEWYITVIGGTILVVITAATLLAPVIAPHDPNEFVGAPFTPPGGGLQTLVARSGESPVAPGADLSGQTVGVQRNKNGSNLAKESELDSVRYQNREALLDGLAGGEVDLIFLDQDVAEELATAGSGFEVVTQELGRRYLLGTDNLGRDITSRLTWGARTVLGVAISSALLASVAGISLGLFSGFAGGRIDRVLSLTMDSIYSFPGLLLAIIMAVMLGPGIFNVAVAISVIYI
ncbi:MAG: hypothetical protein ACC647_00810, partial [Anaerolineales bacterium]